MIHQKDYVEELIKKYIEGTLTMAELVQLKACWKIYDEEELLDMTSAVLCTVKDHVTDVPDDWEPDFAKIIKEADRKQHLKKIRAYGKLAVAACLLLLLVIVINDYITEKWEDPNIVGGCGDKSSSSEIPTSAFGCTVRWGDTTGISFDSSTTGTTTHIDNFTIHQDHAGVLNITPTLSADTGRNHFVEVLTAVRQQCIVRLGSASIRLNAGSSLRIPFMDTVMDTCYVQLTGEAYIKMPGKEKPARMIVETHNNQLQALNGDFTVSVFPGYTKATLINGSISSYSKGGIYHKYLFCPGDQTLVKSYYTTGDQIADSLLFISNTDIEEVLVWTKPTRKYHNASMRQFVIDMSRWCGFEVENINCIPDHLRINTAVCYQASRQQVYAEIRKVGINIYETGNRISFCNPVKQDSTSTAQTAFIQKGKQTTTFTHSISFYIDPCVFY